MFPWKSVCNFSAFLFHLKYFSFWDRCTPPYFFRGRQIIAQYKSQYWTSSTGSIFRLILTPLAFELVWVSEWSEWVSVSDWVSQSEGEEWVNECEWASVSQSVRRGVSEWISQSVSQKRRVFSSGKSDVLKVASEARRCKLLHMHLKRIETAAAV